MDHFEFLATPEIFVLLFHFFSTLMSTSLLSFAINDCPCVYSCIPTPFFTFSCFKAASVISSSSSLSSAAFLSLTSASISPHR